MQKPSLFCTACGAPVPAGQRFCTNCGATIGAGTSDPTVLASGQPQAGAPTLPNANTPPATQSDNDPYKTYTQTSTPPPPPAATAYNPYTASAPGKVQAYSQNASASPGYVPPQPVSVAPGTYAPVPPYAQARKSHGCLITSIVLLLVLAAGIGGVIFWQRSANGPKTGNSPNTHNPTTTNSGGANGGNQGGANSGGTVPLNLKITYASLNITITSVQFASSFSDDHSSNGKAGVVRINLHETNSTVGNPGYLESDALLLMLPDGTTVQSTNQQQAISPDKGVSRDNWVDFPVDSQVTLNQLSLRVGKASQNQMDIPLKPHADLSKFQDRTGNPNAQFQYAGLNWTLQTATLSYSYSDKQATSGNLYVVLTLSVVNNTSSSYTLFPTDVMRIQTGGNSVQPEYDTTLPFSIAASATASGVVGFLVPKDAVSFTLVMLEKPGQTPPVTQVTQAFQIQ